MYSFYSTSINLLTARRTFLAGDAAAGGMTIPVGCVGGIAGYIATAATLSEGGYEVGEIRKNFDLPRRFSPRTGTILESRNSFASDFGIEAIADAHSQVFSLPRPHPDLLDSNQNVPDRLNAYAPAHFRELGYVSGSRGVWRHGSPFNHLAVAAGIGDPS
jgi:hypothetical protein